MQSLTRYVTNIGAPEPVTFGSSQGAVTGCTGVKPQSGGAHVSPIFDDSIPMGPRGGALVGSVGASNCGLNSDLNLNASKQHSNTDLMQRGGSTQAQAQAQGLISEGNVRYGFVDDKSIDLGTFRGSYAPPTVSAIPTYSLVGGSKSSGPYSKYLSLCNMKKLKAITSYGQVREFWSKICPGATSLYENFVHGKGNAKGSSKQTQESIRKFLQYYTKAFCHEVLASHTNDKEIVKKQLRELENAFNVAHAHLRKIVTHPKSEKLHRNILKLHKNRVILYMHRARPDTNRSSSSSSSSSKNMLKKGSSSLRRHSKKRGMKATRKHRHKQHHKKSSGSRSRSRSRSLKSRSKSRSSTKYMRSRSHRRRSSSSKYQHGGYHQFNSNTPISYTQHIVPSGSSNLNSPPSFTQSTGNCVDNYNHYTGKGFETPVLDGDII
jgi:hypothetical protein